ncbi:CHAT domain-containing protein [Aquipuribacter hungaricus]|uniref:CHAT domain-containing protein n=2 Tax=Aquipuribacter hungaricus TaxID=545624 RepID=A0ABV7WIT7_9MICO
MAETFLERAVAAAEVGDDQAARRWAARALDARPGPALRARILVHQAYHVAVTTSVEEGMALLDEVAADPAVDDALRGRVEINRGLLLQRSGDRAARRAFDRALELVPAEEEDTRCTVHLNRGVVAMEARDLVGARADFEAALALARRTGSDLATAMASANLAYCLMLAGDLPAALRGLEAVAPVLGALSPVLAAKCLANRAEVLLAAGLLVEAADDLEQAAATFGRHRNSYEQAEAEHQLARVRLALGEDAAARRLARRAARRFDSRGLLARGAGSRCLALQAQLAAGSRPAAVAREATGTAAWFDEQGLRHEARRARLLAAEAHLAARDPGGAASAAGDAAEPRPRDGVVERLRVRRVRAALADAAGRPGDADRELRTAVRDLQRQVGLLGSLELRSAIAVHAQEIAQVAVGRALAQGDPRRVLDWAETTRALSSRTAAVTPPRDPEESAWLQQLRQARAEERERAAGGTGAVAELERRLRHRAWQREGAGGARDAGVRPVPVARLADGLAGAGGAMLAVLAHRGTLLAVVLGDGRPRLATLGPVVRAVEDARAVRADLDLLAVRGTPAVIADVARRSLASGLARLSAQLLAPVMGLDPARPLLVAPTAVLSLVPWGMLKGLRGRTVTVSATGTSWLRGRPGEWFSRGAGVEAVLGPGLDHGDAELDAVSRAWGGATLTRRADAAAAREAAARADVLHVAAHGVHEPQSPLFSHLRMADGPLFGHELHDLPRLPSHVVLSACELGCAETRAGDERLGMTAALLQAGVGSVVAGVARVEDGVSAQVAAAHHRGLAAGLAPARALAEALAGLPDGSPPAPFVCFGSGW